MMRALTVRGIPDEVYDALKASALENHLSLESHARKLLEASVQEKSFGDSLVALLRDSGLSDEEVDTLFARDRSDSRAIELP